MKKLLVMLIVLFLYCGTCFAEKQEWIDENYNFENVKAVYLDFNFNLELKNGIVEKESQKIFKEKFALDIAKKLKDKDIAVNTKDTIVDP